jgi:hypothetical protein
MVTCFQVVQMLSPTLVDNPLAIASCETPAVVAQWLEKILKAHDQLSRATNWGNGCPTDFTSGWTFPVDRSADILQG